MILSAAAALVLSALFVAWIRSAAHRLEILDHPNDRSSHAVARPRGGGAGMIAALLAVFLLGLWQLDLFPPLLAVPVAGVVLVAIVGWIDDRKSIGVLPRLSAHLVGGLSVLALLLPAAAPGPMKWLFAAWFVFWAVASINVVNFLDGIDGLVGSQFLLFGANLAVLGGICGANSPVRLLAAAIVGSTAGFLIWNWAPARIFLGDSGSGAAGLTIVVGGAMLVSECSVSVVAAFLPLYAIFLDATVTLIRRALRREKLTVAHRSHLYQRLGNGPWGHARTTLLYAVAAALGIVVAALYRSPQWLPFVAVYFAVVLLIGLALDRIALVAS